MEHDPDTLSPLCVQLDGCLMGSVMVCMIITYTHLHEMLSFMHGVDCCRVYMQKSNLSDEEVVTLSCQVATRCCCYSETKGYPDPDLDPG